jgi:serine/threonine-protein kinase
MGQVWVARHTTLGHHVAIKLLDAAQGNLSSRFEREAKVCARIADQTPHVVRVVDYGFVDSSGEARPYLAMELLVGETLAQRLQRETRLHPRLVLELVRQLCHALRVTHQAGVVHRDIKPSNVFLCESGARDVPLVKLLDFGIAKAPAASDADGLTRTGTLLGTPGFISPEQIKGESRIDGRADLWALAAVVYRALTGTKPFGSGSFEEVTARILWAEVKPPTALVPELPAAIDDWMRRGLARHREDRFTGADEMLTTFERACEGEGVMLPASTQVARPAALSDAPTAPVELAPMPAQADDKDGSLVSAEVPPQRSAREGISLRWGGGATLVAAIAILAWWQGSNQPIAAALEDGRDAAVRANPSASSSVSVAAGSATGAWAPPPVVASAAPTLVSSQLSPPPSGVLAQPATAPAAKSPAPRAKRAVKPSETQADAAQRSGWNATGEL